MVWKPVKNNGRVLEKLLLSKFGDRTQQIGCAALGHDLYHQMRGPEEYTRFPMFLVEGRGQQARVKAHGKRAVLVMPWIDPCWAGVLAHEMGHLGHCFLLPERSQTVSILAAEVVANLAVMRVLHAVSRQRDNMDARREVYMQCSGFLNRLLTGADEVREQLAVARHYEPRLVHAPFARLVKDVFDDIG